MGKGGQDPKMNIFCVIRELDNTNQRRHFKNLLTLKHSLLSIKYKIQLVLFRNIKNKLKII